MNSSHFVSHYSPLRSYTELQPCHPLALDALASCQRECAKQKEKRAKNANQFFEWRYDVNNDGIWFHAHNIYGIHAVGFPGAKKNINSPMRSQSSNKHYGAHIVPNKQQDYLLTLYCLQMWLRTREILPRAVTKMSMLMRVWLCRLRRGLMPS